MTTNSGSTSTTGTAAVERLRAWARGAYDCEAGVELLIRSGLLEATGAGAAWPIGGGLDADALDAALDSGSLSGGKRRTALVVLSLLGGPGHQVDLAAVLPGLDRGALDLVLAALAHAGGSHQHCDIRYDEYGVISGFGQGYLPSLHPWPAQR